MNFKIGKGYIDDRRSIVLLFKRGMFKMYPDKTVHVWEHVQEDYYYYKWRLL